jgi:DNA polymerase III sliding clamp (beta) subunit (PCNA family)
MLTLPRKDFTEAVKFALSCSGVKDVRYYLNSVAFDMCGDVLHVVGLDGHRQAVVKFRGRTLPAEGVWTLTRSTVKEMLAAVGGKTGDVGLTFGGEGVLVETGELSFAAPLLACKYPDWRRVSYQSERLIAGTETAAVGFLGVNAGYLADAAKACKAMANSKYAGIKTYVGELGSGQSLTISAGICEADFREVESAYVLLMGMRV